MRRALGFARGAFIVLARSMRSARIFAIIVAALGVSSRALAGVDVVPISDTNGRIVVEIRKTDDRPAFPPFYFFAAIAPTGTYSARYRIGPVPAPGQGVAAAAAIDSITVSQPIVFRGSRVLCITVRIPGDTPLSNVTIDYTPASNVVDGDDADPLLKSLVVNQNVFPVTPRTGSTDPWFSRTPNWVRLTVGTRGMYTVTGADLVAAGMSLSTIDPETMRLFTGGGLNQNQSLLDPTASWHAGQAMREVSLRVDAGSDGTFDPGDRIVFYGMPALDWADYYDPSAPDTLYHEHTHATQNVYFLSWGGSFPDAPRRMLDHSSSPTLAADVTTYRHRVYSERDLLSDYNFRGDGWLWLDIGSPSLNLNRLATIDVTNMVASVPQTFRTVALSRFVDASDATASNIGHHAVYFNSRNGAAAQAFAQKIWDGGDNYYETGRPVRADASFLAEGSNTILMQVPGDLNSRDKMLFAWFSLAYQRRIVTVGGAVGFSSPDTTGALNFSARGFSGSDAIHVFDVTDAWNPERVTDFQVANIAGGRSVRFSSVHTGTKRHFWASTTSGLQKPGIARIAPRDLRADATGPHMLIVTHRSFLAAAERLRSYRAGNRVPLVSSPLVEIVTTDEVFDNFSQGVADPMAIRNYIKYLFENYPTATGTPRLAYVCFLGDATTDFQNHASSQPDFVPTNLYFTRLAPYAFATDEWYGQMDVEDQVPGSDILDLALGRLPAASLEEAQFLVDRVINYETASPLDDWRNEAIVVADDEFSSQPTACETQWTTESEWLTYDNAPSFLDVTKIYLTEYPKIVGVKPGSRFRFLDEWSDGALVINFIGHGSSQQMADEQVFLGSDISQLTNGLKLPLMMAYSCTIGDFANPAGKCLSEKLLLHDAGGAIATLTSSNESYPTPNNMLDAAMFERALPRRLGEEYRPLGVGVMQAKAVAQVRGFFGPFSADNHWKYNLLCDPALTLRMPKHEIRFDVADQDTLIAGTRQTVRGSVYIDGAPAPSFDGPVRVTVREPVTVRTYDPTCSSQMLVYTLPGGIMYEGTTDATNGQFEVNFRVPRYAMTGPRAGASAYAYDGSTDAGATIDSALVVVAPTLADSLALEPRDGAPRVSLGFKSGLSVVKPGDSVRAIVRDQDGINILATTNEGRQAILLDNLPIPIDANEFFSFDHGGVDTSGVLLFPLPDLAVGQHRMVYKVSDSFGATTLDTLSFSVTDAQNYFAEAVLNFPNPFRDSTQLLFRLSDRASIQLDFYTVSGKRVRTLKDTRDGGETWIEWDGRDAAGGDLANGTYLYVATVDFVGLDRAPVVLRGKLSKVR